MTTDVLFSTAGPVATITINRAAQRNAVNADVSAALEEFLVEFESETALRVAILTGAGDRAFCAGADLKAAAAGSADGIITARGGFAGFARFPRSKPVIAAVNGAALAGGCELVLSCDIAVAADHATFGLPEVKRGLVAGAGGVLRLSRFVPHMRALELILTGDPINADEAYGLGLVNHVVPDGMLHPTADRIARRIAENSPLAVRESLGLARAAAWMREEEAWRYNEGVMSRIVASDDAAEGPRAFAEKRPPRWTGT